MTLLKLGVSGLCCWCDHLRAFRDLVLAFTWGLSAIGWCATLRDIGRLIAPVLTCNDVSEVPSLTRSPASGDKFMWIYQILTPLILCDEQSGLSATGVQPNWVGLRVYYLAWPVY